MTKSILAIASFIVSSVALADGMPPGAVGMPARNPCDFAQAHADAKQTLVDFDAFYAEASAKGKAPVPREHVSREPIVGICNVGNLRRNAGIIRMGIAASRNACGVNYVFKSKLEVTRFAKWAYKSIQNHAVETAAPICVSERKRRVGLPIHH